MDNHAAMQLAIACARSVEGRTSPRPPVGAVVVQDGTVVGTGATSPPYGPHAEVHALNAAGSAAYGADLYVTLEPCCITVHTPPCTDAIIQAGIRRVFIAALDPNPRVYQQGVELLRQAGIEVFIEVEEVATDIIRPFATLIKKGRPYVTAKWAMTLDGKIATASGDARWISGERSRLWVHQLRDRVDAIMVGAHTALVDDPQLTVRLPVEEQGLVRQPRSGPIRVVVSTNGELPSSLRLLQPDLASGTWVLVGETCMLTQQQVLSSLGVTVIPVPLNEQGKVDIEVALSTLAQRGIMHLLIEGGAQLLGSAFRQQVIDHVAVFIAPKILGDAAAPSPLIGSSVTWMQDATRLHSIQSHLFDEDILLEGEFYH
ncbi:bifunctional diaminohydroxyphosphoribosylaminopyrimidine deaminase/5-amino-6-(5-phosphoribosylamino)uracil reductase RibD [Tengunoibacter tsumagoiensis]|uniref:Riboflavin biosynthesis protein RibD n=1 Tax=Tengunoibacter tsumagoiensis TaxID=2014871 RepID=A0A402AAN0_9CHLR|nr:bifunctional diaminohydroxyphosphoribosylaminopyrimidine deaminase/5-amino-6-(5-phosphoribosylamino)uracil reductase RibD [Tengunoibacter tsumagoiensis]GCE16180.1 riboflavin biosynthesis protein RibD [Tengunoibacter tsumagoiensis]